MFLIPYETTRGKFMFIKKKTLINTPLLGETFKLLNFIDISHNNFQYKEVA